jgi:hypothetical protein
MDLCFECGKLVDEYYNKRRGICKDCYSGVYYSVSYPLIVSDYPYVISNFLKTPPNYYNDKEINEFIKTNYTHNPYHCKNHISVHNRYIFFFDYDPMCPLCFINKLRYN